MSAFYEIYGCILRYVWGSCGDDGIGGKLKKRPSYFFYLD